MAHQIDLKFQSGLGRCDPATERTCRRCEAAIEPVRTILDSTTGRELQMFECGDCGQRAWDH